MTTKKNIEAISNDIQELKGNVSTVLEKIECLLARDESRDAEIQKLKIDNTSLKCKVASLEGLTFQMQIQLEKVMKRLNDVENRARSRNAVFTNIMEPQGTGKENCEETIRAIMASKMKIPRERFHNINPAGDIRIEVAYRIGKKSKAPRPMLVIFSDIPSKRICFSHSKYLGGTKIALADDLSDETREKRVAQVPLLKEYKTKCGKEVRVSMFKDKLSVGGKVIDPNFSSNKLTLAPQSQDMRPVNMDAFSIIQSNTDQNAFTGYACEISNYEEACMAHASLFQLKEVASATHRVYAYSYEGQDGHDDDGEFSASKQILQSLKSRRIQNYYVCVTRQYGKNMGKKRFSVYEDLAGQALSAFFPELS